MAALDGSKIKRVKAEFCAELARSRELVQQSKRLPMSMAETVERSWQVLEQSRQLIAKAKPERLLNRRAGLIQLLRLLGELVPYSRY